MERRLGLRALAIAALALITAAAGLGGFLLTREAARDDGRRAFLQTLAPAQADFEGAVNAALVGITRLGSVPRAELARSADSTAATLGLEVVVYVPDGSSAAASAVSAARAGGVALHGAQDLATLLQPTFELARDTAGVRASPPIGSAGGPVSLLVLPRFGPGETGTTAARRMSVEGYVVGVLDPQQPAATLLAPVAGDGVVEVFDRGTSLFRAGGDASGNERAVRTQLAVAGRTWVVVASPQLPGVDALAWLVLAAGLLLSLGIVASGVHLQRVERLAKDRARARDDDLSTVAGLGPLLQQSLDLAEVLPAAAAFFADRFDLDGVSITYADGEVLVEAYTVGRRPADVPQRPSELHPVPSQLAAHETASVPLLRGGRVVGALHVSPRIELGPDRTSTLVAVAEMLGTALANARQFEREQEAVRRLQELDRLKHEFLGTVSHELQTPITAILGFSSILSQEYDSIDLEQRLDYLARVQRNATSLSALVRQLLDFSRLGRPSFELHVQSIDLSELTAEIVDRFSTVLEKRPLVVNAAPGVWAFADPEAVERVLTNLLSNAAKYSPPGSAITLTIDHDADGARLTVDDMGPGVDEEDRPHIFDRFYRGSSPAAVGSRGVGIGLAVVKDLVERMSGRVSVGSAPDGGARFCVILPAEPHDDDSHQPPPEPAGQGRLT